MADDVAVVEDCIVGVDEGPPDSPDLHLHLPLCLWPSNNNITSPGAENSNQHARDTSYLIGYMYVPCTVMYIIITYSLVGRLSIKQILSSDSIGFQLINIIYFKSSSSNYYK